MKKFIIILLLLPVITLGQEMQTLSLTKAYELAQQNYPMIKQRDLLRQTTGINIDNLSKGFLPQVNLSGQATYQSDVTKFTMPITGAKVAPLSNDQYRVLADVNQLIYDGGVIKEQKNIERLNEDAEQQKVEVELYKLKDRINQLFLGVLYLDAQAKQVDLVKDDLNNGIKKTEAQVKNGVAFRSNLNMLKAELLKADQRLIEIKASRKGLTDVLGLFINQTLPDDVHLERPLMEIPSLNNEILRPELKLFNTEENLLNGQYKLIDSRNRPKAGLFVQGGYGRPGLNYLDNSFAFFYTTGLRFNWSFGGLYTEKKEKQLIEVYKKSINVQKETFLLNINTSLKQQESEVDKLKQLIVKDNEIIDLRVSVKDAANAQLENGVITANDYLREVNAEDQARQLLITHQVQLLQAQINYQTISGKQ
jgi:outer membrane protein TolC